MANYLRDEDLRKMSISITLNKKDLDFIDEIAHKNRVSRSHQIRAIVEGYLYKSEEVEANVIRENQQAREDY